MTEPLWRGPAVALITLFHPDASIDPAGTAAHAARLVAAGIRGVLVNGSTAEAAALTEDEVAGAATGPLAGMTFAVKDLIDVAGLPTRCGSNVLADAPPAAADAPAVARLRAAGIRIGFFLQFG